MKLGLVLECDVGGADELVLTCFARRLSPGISIVPSPQGSKAGVFTKGTEAAAKLVETDKCDLVLIVWDLKPYWTQVTARNCRDEVKEMRQQLEALPPATREKIRMLCLNYELETWLIADERAVTTYLSRPAHPVEFPRIKKPALITDAKAYLNTAVVQVRGRGNRYVDSKEAIRIAQLVPDTKRMGKVESFERFASLITGTTEADFKQAGTACSDLTHRASQMGRS
jgi:hypothetical protein